MINKVKLYIKKLAAKYIKDYGTKIKQVEALESRLKNSLLDLKKLEDLVSKTAGYYDAFGSFYKELSPLRSSVDQKKVYQQFLVLIDGIDDDKSIALASHFFSIYMIIASSSTNRIQISRDGFLLPKSLYEIVPYSNKSITDSIRNKFNIMPEYTVETTAMKPYSYGLGCLPENFAINQIKGKTIIDAGAYSGETALFFEEDFSPALIYSFEPDRTTFKDLVNMLKLNKKDTKIIPSDIALSDENSTTVFYNAVKKLASGIVDTIAYAHELEDERYDVKTQTIDSFIAEHPQAPPVGFIKADVEGAGLMLIKGAIETIKRDKPIIIVAIYHTPEEFFGIKPFIQNLNLGYKFIIRKPLVWNDPVVETVLIAYCEK